MLKLLSIVLTAVALQNVNALQCYHNFDQQFTKPGAPVNVSHTVSCPGSCYKAKITLITRGCADPDNDDRVPRIVPSGLIGTNYTSCRTNKCNAVTNPEDKPFTCYQYFEAEIPTVFAKKTKKALVGCKLHCFVSTIIGTAHGCTTDFLHIFNTTEAIRKHPNSPAFELCATDKCNL